MAKRLQKEIELFKARDNVKLTFGVLVCTILASFSLVVAAFTLIPITHYSLPWAAILHPINFWNSQHEISEFVTKIEYVPQIPTIAFMTIILGKRFSCLAIFLYLIAGLFFVPVFSLGGGMKYIFQYSFGYLLGFFPMVIILSNYLKQDFSPKKVFLGSLYSVMTLHLFGMVYLVLLCAIRQESFGYVQDLLTMMTAVKFLYDLFFTFVSVYIANLVRKFLWLSMD